MIAPLGVLPKGVAMRGSLNTALIRVGEAFKAALRRNSAALIVVHNHASGDGGCAGELLDVKVLDHLVIGQGGGLIWGSGGWGFRVRYVAMAQSVWCAICRWVACCYTLLGISLSSSPPQTNI